MQGRRESRKNGMFREKEMGVGDKTKWFEWVFPLIDVFESYDLQALGVIDKDVKASIIKGSLKW